MEIEARRRTRSTSSSHRTPERRKNADHGGETQTRSSRKREIAVPKDASAPLEAESKDRKTEKRRRSSFVRGRSRKSIGTTNTDVTELHTKIPTDLPAEERLRLLKLACFEYSISKLHEEFPILATKEDFQTNAQAEFDSYLQGLVDDGTLKAACYSASRSENPANLEMETQISQLDKEIERLGEESKQWDQLRTSFSQRAEEAARSEMGTAPTKKLVTLSGDQFKLLSDLPDLAAISDWAGESQKKVALQIDQLAKTSKKIQAITASVNAFLSQETRLLAQESSRGYAGIDDPKELLLKSGK